jgi:pyridoxal phosphate enzyme (YggS family)
MTIAENLASIRGRIATAAERAGRDPSAVRLVGASSASKGVTQSMVEQAIEAGLLDFGENFVQEAEQRIAPLGPLAVKATWHFIGHLQSNKAAQALRYFSVIQSVDSLRLAQQLSRRATRPVRILLEVNVAGEESKFGLAPGEVSSVVESVCGLPNLELVGLMTMAPAVSDPEQVRPVFRELRQLAEANGLHELSMGMTDDFEVAVEEGATMVRLGRAIFGERP